MAGNNSIQILRGNSQAIVNAANNNTTLLDGQLLYNIDKNYLTIGRADNNNLTASPIVCREMVGYQGDTQERIGQYSDTEEYSIRASSCTTTPELEITGRNGIYILGNKFITEQANNIRVDATYAAYINGGNVELMASNEVTFIHQGKDKIYLPAGAGMLALQNSRYLHQMDANIAFVDGGQAYIQFAAVTSNNSPITTFVNLRSQLNSEGSDLNIPVWGISAEGGEMPAYPFRLNIQSWKLFTTADAYMCVTTHSILTCSYQSVVTDYVTYAI